MINNKTTFLLFFGTARMAMACAMMMATDLDEDSEEGDNYYF